MVSLREDHKEQCKEHPVSEHCLFSSFQSTMNTIGFLIPLAKARGIAAFGSIIKWTL